jgi:outer membrane protein OmpA-like peptidoglycan-associated protein
MSVIGPDRFLFINCKGLCMQYSEFHEASPAVRTPNRRRRRLPTTPEPKVSTNTPIPTLTHTATAAQSFFTPLQLQVFFAEGSDTVNTDELPMLKNLATFLVRNRVMQLRLDAFSDGLGTDEYNNVLSVYRAQHVAAYLIAEGVAATRIQCHAHGNRFSRHCTKDNQARALERRVEITLSLTPAVN